jgi:transcriptional regulator with XRE-family HTH domain
MRTKKSSAKKFLESLAGPLTLSSFVESIREGEEWTKKDMAETLGVSSTYYSDFVAGKKPVSPQKAAEWAKLLGYDEHQFVKLALEDLLERFGLDYEVELNVRTLSRTSSKRAARRAI